MSAADGAADGGGAAARPASAARAAEPVPAGTMVQVARGAPERAAAGQLASAQTASSLVRSSAWSVNHGISWRSSHQRTPSSYEVASFARFIGMDPVADGPLLWIAEEALCAPLPAGWEEEERADGTPLYRHESGQLSDHHPLEEHYRAVVSGLRDRPSTPSARAPPRGVVGDAEPGSVVPPTPDEVRAMAEFLGVDPLDEFPLLNLAYEAVAAPLPGRWIELADLDEAQYFEKDTANLKTTHPADSAIFEELERSRSAASGYSRDRPRDEAAYWMHFHDADGKGYYYNWLTGRQLSRSPQQQDRAAQTIQAGWRHHQWRCALVPRHQLPGLH